MRCIDQVRTLEVSQFINYTTDGKFTSQNVKFNRNIQFYTPIINPKIKYFYYPSCKETILAAYMKRHKPVILEEYDENIDLFPFMKKYHVQSKSWDEQTYIQSMKPPSKSAMYQRAYEKYLQDHRIRYTVTPFTKIEKMKTTKYKAPRLIQAYDPMFNIKFGRHIKALEHKTISHKKIGKHFGKGTTELISNKILYFSKKYKWYTEGDHKSFDAHVTDEQNAATHRSYAACTQHDKELQKMAKKTRVNKCMSQSGDRYKIKGTVMSGSPDTSFKNCKINLAILDRTIAVYRLTNPLFRGEAIVNGDDFIIFSNYAIDIKLFASLLRCCNMECELLPSTNVITNVSFCGSKLCICENGQSLLIHDFTKVLDTFGMTHRVNVDRERYLNDLAICFAYMHAHEPIGHAFSTAFNIKITPNNIPIPNTVEDKLQYIMSTLTIPFISTGIITDSIYRAYPDIDKWISKIHALPSLIKSKTSSTPINVHIDHNNEQISVTETNLK